MVCIRKSVIAQGKIFWQASDLGPWFLPILVECISAASGPRCITFNQACDVCFLLMCYCNGVCDLGSWPMQGNFCSLGPLALLVTRLVMFVLSSGATPVCTSVPPTAASASVATPATSAPRRSWSRLLSSSLCAAAYTVLYSQTINCGSDCSALGLILWQYPLLAPSVRCPQRLDDARGRVFVYSMEWTEMWICQRSAYFRFIPSTHAHIFSYRLRTANR